jgi:hypothetical protein
VVTSSGLGCQRCRAAFARPDVPADWFRGDLGAWGGADFSAAIVREKNLSALAAINRELVAKAETIDPPQRVVLDMNGTEIPVYGQQENCAHNGHFESTCYHPLLLFNREGDCLAATTPGITGCFWQRAI